MKQLPQEHQWTNQLQLQQSNSASPGVHITSNGIRRTQSQTKFKYNKLIQLFLNQTMSNCLLAIKSVCYSCDRHTILVSIHD